MQEKNWIINQVDEDKLQKFKIESGLKKSLLKVLMGRGLDSKEKLTDFLNTDINALSDPFLLPDIEKACERIKKAIESNEKIVVYGDYDVDGITSTAMLVKYLRGKGARVSYYIPRRLSEGYGLSICALDSIAAEGCDLIITVDTGVTALLEVQHAKSLGIDIVITDHHECPEILPEACAVVNPKVLGCAYPFSEIAGVGVVFMLLSAMENDLEKITDEYSYLAALGTIADVMPLLGPNRFIVKHGLSKIETNSYIGLDKLMNKSGIDKKCGIDSMAIGYSIAPRINAAGRLECAMNAVELFLTEQEREAEEIAQRLCDQNLKRQTTEAKIMEDVLNQLSKEGENEDKIMILEGEDWHFGVIGIVASRLIDRLCRPVIMISWNGESGKGSGRSVKGFNLFEGLMEHRELLEQCGGHEMAAGLTIKKENIAEFRRRLKEYAGSKIKEEDLTPKLYIDAEMEPCELSLEFIEELQKFAPFGAGNRVPLFALRNCEICSAIPIGSNKHMKIEFSFGDEQVTGFLFGVSPDDFEFLEGERVDVAGTVEKNVFRGRETLRVHIRDLRQAQEDRENELKEKKVLEKYERNEELTEGEIEALSPCREDFIALYQLLKSKTECEIRTKKNMLYREIKHNSLREIGCAKTKICLEVFKELGILSFKETKTHFMIELLPVKEKINLQNSKILKRLAP